MMGINFEKVEEKNDGRYNALLPVWKQAWH